MARRSAAGAPVEDEVARFELIKGNAFNGSPLGARVMRERSSVATTGRGETSATDEVAGSAEVEFGMAQSPSVRRATTMRGTRVTE